MAATNASCLPPAWASTNPQCSAQAHPAAALCWQPVLPGTSMAALLRCGLCWTDAVPQGHMMTHYDSHLSPTDQVIITAHKEEILNERRRTAHWGATLVTGFSGGRSAALCTLGRLGLLWPSRVAPCCAVLGRLCREQTVCKMCCAWQGTMLSPTPSLCQSMMCS
jgi:hypothetical protein